MDHQPIDKSGHSAGRIPHFENRQDEADWWDSHDITDYLDELTSVELSVGEDLSGAVTLVLGADVIRAVHQKARAQGISPASLLTAWVLDRLEADDRRSA